jgi:DNA-binding beta-propeller fold protein YncE
MKRRAFLAASLGMALSPARALGTVEGGGFVVLVTADLEAHVVAVDVGSGRVVKRIQTPGGPRSIESTPFGHVVVAHTSTGRISILDASTLTVRSILGGFGEPRYAAMHTFERLAYVTDSSRAEVVTVDLVRGRVVHRLAVPGAARHISLDADRATLWTALGTKAERIAVLDLADPHRPRLARVIAPPFLAHDVGFAPDGRHVWVTSGSKRAIAVYGSAVTAPRILRAGSPPQHVAFAEGRALVASGEDGTMEVRRLDGRLVRTSQIPPGSYNVSYGDTPLGRSAAASPSLDRGTVCVLSPAGRVRLVRHVARSAHDACLVFAA